MAPNGTRPIALRMKWTSPQAHKSSFRLCTALLKRVLGPACRAPSMPFNGFNAVRCGRHRICHGQSVKTGVKCETYVYKGHTRCTACQRNEEVNAMTVASEDEEDPAFFYLLRSHCIPKQSRKGEEKEQKKKMAIARPPPKSME